jgi:EpsI family protein
MTLPDSTSRHARGLDRRKVIAGLGLVGLAGVVQARQPVPNRPRIPQKTLEGMIPNQVGRFTFETASGFVLPPSDALGDRLYDNLITRAYVSPQGELAMFLIAYNNRQDGVLQIHRPEVCYPAGGFVLSPVAPIEIPLPQGPALPAQIFEARGEQRNEVVSYWTRVGDEFPRQWSEQRLAVAQANLRGIIPDGALVRLSTVANEADRVAPMFEDFIADFFRASPPRLRNLLFNTPLPTR